jgi:hypothetical protein
MRSKHKSLVAAALLITLALIPYHAIGQNPAPSQNAPRSGSSGAQSNQAKDKDNSCADNGTYVNSKGETVKRPETCSSRMLKNSELL